jgi:hypothetical protein
MKTTMKVKDIANRLGLDPSTVRQWLVAGQGPKHVRTPRGHYRFLDATEVERWIDGLGCSNGETGTEEN